MWIPRQKDLSQKEHKDNREADALRQRTGTVQSYLLPSVHARTAIDVLKIVDDGLDLRYFGVQPNWNGSALVLPRSFVESIIYVPDAFWIPQYGDVVSELLLFDPEVLARGRQFPDAGRGKSPLNDVLYCRERFSWLLEKENRTKADAVMFQELSDCFERMPLLWRDEVANSTNDCLYNERLKEHRDLCARVIEENKARLEVISFARGLAGRYLHELEPPKPVGDYLDY